MMPDTAAIRRHFLALQTRIVAALAALDGRAFREERWERPQGEALTGDGLTCITEDGPVLERGGVNFSHVRGASLPPSASARRPELAGRAFEALGVSLVLHPRNPYFPTVHLNVRAFVATAEGLPPVWWFGGGMDLTPYYPFVEDIVHFHRTCRDAVLGAGFGEAHYRHYKRWCDEYFYLKHREEPRGVGGLFFDDLGADGTIPFESAWRLTQAVGDAFLPAYLPILEQRLAHPYGERERDFQAYRRGRYVEFNLVWDRGTHFGLQSGGRTEAILMSLPPLARWRYDWHPEPGSPEAALYEALRPRDWAERSAEAPLTGTE